MPRRPPVRVLLIEPSTPPAYWDFRYTVGLAGCGASTMPLSTLTVAAHLPETWDLRVIDARFQEYTMRDLVEVDVVMISAWIIHRAQVRELANMCRIAGRPLIVGGWFPWQSPEAEELRGTTIVLGELEDSVMCHELVTDIECRSLKERYVARGMPALDESPTPRFDLINARNYYSGALQITRGCPYRCNFCTIWMAQGRNPRVKSPTQVVLELDALYAAGHRGVVFFTDDNIIGQVRDILPVLEAVAQWQEENDYPFTFYSQSDVRIGSRKFEHHLDLMRQCGFFALFLGLETDDPEALVTMRKPQNDGIDYPAVTRRLREHGIHTYAGGIVGADGDTPAAFDRLVEMFTECGIFFAMPSMRVALPGTEDTRKLAETGRLLGETGGDNLGLTNILPAPGDMTRYELVTGFRGMLARLYDPNAYFARAEMAVREWRPGVRRHVGVRDLRAAASALVLQGFVDPEAASWRRYFTGTVVRSPARFPQALAIGMTGRHVIRMTRDHWIPGLDKVAEQVRHMD